MYLKQLDSDDKVYLINDNDRNIRYRIKPDTFTEQWCVNESEFYTQNLVVDGETITFALPW